MAETLYDQKCYDLAETFLEDDDRTNPDRDTLGRHAHQLAGQIQQTIEDYFFSIEHGLIDASTGQPTKGIE